MAWVGRQPVIVWVLFFMGDVIARFHECALHVTDGRCDHRFVIHNGNIDEKDTG